MVRKSRVGWSSLWHRPLGTGNTAEGVYEHRSVLVDIAGPDALSLEG